MRIAILTTDNREHYRQYGTKEPHFGAAPEALLQGFSELREHEFHVLGCIQARVVSPSKLSENIWFHSLHVPKLGWMRTGYSGCIRAIRRKLREIQPDIVHGQGTERECGISAVLSGFPNVITIHGNMAELARMFRARVGSFGWLAARLEDWTLPRTAGVFCNSAYTERLVSPRTKRIWRVANAIRAQFFTGKPPAVSKGSPVFINIGAVSARKQQVEILKVAKQLFEGGVPMEFNFIGQHSTSTDYGAAFAREMRLASEARYGRYLGIKSVAEIVGCLDQARAMVHFPLEEAFGLVVAEGLARNLKFFGSNVGGILDITEGVESAELFPPDGCEELCSGIEQWIAKGCPAPMDAADLMRERYHPAVIAGQHLEIYREVLAAKH